METELYTLDDTETDDAVFARAAALLRAGELVAFPTETVYGLGASALDADAARRIYEAKGRPSDNPLIVHIADPAEADAVAYVPYAYRRLAARFMPGPLTVIMPKRACIPDGVTGGLDTVAVRCPSHPAARRLIETAELPIAAPSANRSGSPSPTTAQHVLRDLGGRIRMILDGGPCEIGLESTVIRLTESGCEILRPGAVTERMLADVLGEVTVARAVTDPGAAGEHPQSPGMKYKHYAPAAQVVLIDAVPTLFTEYVRAVIRPGEAVAVPDDEAALYDGCSVLSLGQTHSAAEASHALFSLLREADIRGYSRLYIALPPPTGEYLALYNRLIRAAGGRVVRLNPQP